MTCTGIRNQKMCAQSVRRRKIRVARKTMLIWMRIGWMLQKYYYTRKLGIEASITRGARRVIAGISVVLVQIVATEYTLAASMLETNLR